MDFLFENWYLLILAYFLYAAFRNRGKSTEEEASKVVKKPATDLKAARTTGGWPQPEAESTSGRYEDTDAAITQSRSVSASPQKSQHSSLVDKMAELDVSRARRIAGDEIADAIGQSARNKGGGVVRKTHRKLHASRAREGMIWSEVYAQPRAKRPHQLEVRPTKQR